MLLKVVKWTYSFPERKVSIYPMNTFMTRLRKGNWNKENELNSDYGVFQCLLNIKESKKCWSPHETRNPNPEIGGTRFPSFVRYSNSLRVRLVRGTGRDGTG